MRERPPERQPPTVASGLRPVTLGLSLALHLVGFGIVYGLPRLLPRPVPRPSVYVVDLVSLPSAPPSRRSATAPTPPKRPAATKRTRQTPTPKKTVKVPDRRESRPPVKKQPPRPEPAKPDPVDPDPVATDEPETAKLSPEPSPERPDRTTPATSPGAGGGVGVRIGDEGASGGTPGDEYTFYLSLLNRNIRRAWREPLYTGTSLLTVTVALEVNSTGRMLRLELAEPSGYGPLDRSVIRAVRDAGPFPPFPHFLRRDSLTVRIIFDLTPHGEGAAPSGD